MTIIEQLNQLGLNGRQARVYLALLQLGSATAIEIAKYTKYKHPTVYDVLDLLKEKRLITETLSGKRKIFSAVFPHSGGTSADAGFPSSQSEEPLSGRHPPDARPLL